MKSRIKSFFHGSFRLLKKKRVFIPLIVVVIIVLISARGSAENIQSLVIEQKEFVQEVSLTGKVKAVSDVSMGFELSGRVADIKKTVGQEVEANEIIANIANTDKQASLIRAQASVDVQLAALNEARKGSRAEDIRIAETDVLTAENTLTQSLQSLVEAIGEAYTKSDDVVRSKVDALFKNPRTVNPEIFAVSDNYNLQISINKQRLEIGEALAIWQKNALGLSSDKFTQERITEARTNLANMKKFLNDLSFAASTLQDSIALSQATIDTYRANISTARTTINGASAALTSAEQTYNNAVTGLKRSQDTLVTKKISTPEKIQAEEARLKSAQADLLSAQAEYGKTLIRAPFKGVVTRIDVKKGEIVSPNTPVIDVIAKDSYEVETYASEIDISKVQKGQTAYMTFDACNKDEKAQEMVMQIDPAETVKDGVNTYKVLLSLVNFKLQSCEVKTGMTANIVIETARKPGAIVVPQEAITLKSARKMVKVIRNGKESDIAVSTGGIDTQGNIEILSGLIPGDEVRFTVK